MLTVTLKGFEEADRIFGSALTERATRPSINDTARSVRTATGRELRRTWNIKARDLNRKLRVAKLARISDLKAVVDATSRPISLSYFGARGLKRSGVSVSIRKGRRFVLGKAFVRTMPNKYVGVFRGVKGSYHTPTRGKYAGKRGRTEIRNLASITVASMFRQRSVQGVAEKTIDDVFPRRLSYHIGRLSKRK